MKITINAYKDSVTWESEADDVDLEEVIHQIKGLLVAAGFHPKKVDEYFTPDAFEWFPEANEQNN